MVETFYAGDIKRPEDWTICALFHAGFWVIRLRALRHPAATITFVPTSTIIPFMPNG
jgi:hypothetical protein